MVPVSQRWGESPLSPTFSLCGPGTVRSHRCPQKIWGWAGEIAHLVCGLLQGKGKIFQAKRTSTARRLWGSDKGGGGMWWQAHQSDAAVWGGCKGVGDGHAKRGPPMTIDLDTIQAGADSPCCFDPIDLMRRRHNVDIFFISISVP